MRRKLIGSSLLGFTACALVTSSEASAATVLSDFQYTSDIVPGDTIARTGHGASFVFADCSDGGNYTCVASALLQFELRITSPGEERIPVPVDINFSSFVAAGGHSNFGFSVFAQSYISIDEDTLSHVVSPFLGNTFFFGTTLGVENVLDQNGESDPAASISELVITRGQTSTITNGPINANNSADFEDSDALVMFANTTYVVSLWSTVIANSYSPNDINILTTAYSFTDPFFQIASDFLVAHPDFTLQFSPGIQNIVTNPIPLPSSGYFVLSGVAIMAAVRRRSSGDG